MPRSIHDAGENDEDTLHEVKRRACLHRGQGSAARRITQPGGRPGPSRRARTRRAALRAALRPGGPWVRLLRAEARYQAAGAGLAVTAAELTAAELTAMAVMAGCDAPRRPAGRPLAYRWPLWSQLPRPLPVPGVLAGICVVDPGLAVDPVHGDAPDQPRNPDPPRSSPGAPHHGPGRCCYVTRGPRVPAGGPGGDGAGGDGAGGDGGGGLALVIRSCGIKTTTSEGQLLAAQPHPRTMGTHTDRWGRPRPPLWSAGVQ